jgi:MOSC domain-containing protein YiiM
MIARVLVIRIGRPQVIDDGQPWTTSFYRPVHDGPARLGRTHLEGDAVADARVHGGADKAVCVYSADNFPAWQRVLARDDFSDGAFGENFTVTGLTEPDVCIGDQFRIGTALVEVSQPRMPCWKLGRRWNRQDLPKLVTQSGRSGWYFRVRREGVVEAGQPIDLLERRYPEWTIARVNDVFYRGTDPEEALRLAACDALANAWRRPLEERLV